MSLPHTLKRFNFFGDGKSWLGIVEEIELPKFKKKVEQYRGAGMMAPAPIDLGYEALEGNLTFGGVNSDALKMAFAAGTGKAVMRFSGAYQADDTCEVKAVDVYMRGMFKEVDMGTAKQGDKNKVKMSYELSYIKLIIAGETVVEIDALTTLETDFKGAIGI